MSYQLKKCYKYFVCLIIPESPRYTFLNRNSELHSKGHRHLLKDDVPLPIIEKKDVENVLSDREAQGMAGM